MTLDEILAAVRAAETVVIVGGPGSGKSYLAHLADPERRRTRCTDDLTGVLEWSEVSAEVARWIDEPGPWIIEGVATARALRKWLRASTSPAGLIVLMAKPYIDRGKGQAAMAKGVATVWREIAPELLARGARVLKHDGTPHANTTAAQADSANAGAASRAGATASARG